MKKYLFLLVFSFHFCVLFSQKNVIDKVVAIVGEEIILKSDIENAFLQEQGRGLISSSANYRTELLEQQLIQKLLLAQAQVDSISVTEEEAWKVSSANRFRKLRTKCADKYGSA